MNAARGTRRPRGRAGRGPKVRGGGGGGSKKSSGCLLLVIASPSIPAVLATLWAVTRHLG